MGKVTGPAKNVFGNSKARQSPHGAMPQSKNIRTTVKHHSQAPKARTTKASDNVFPHAARDIATAGKPR